MVISFFPIMLIVFLMVFFIARAIGGKGKPVLSEPYCAKCGYDLRVNWDSSMACPECGADLKAKNAVNFGKVKKRSWWWVLIPIVLLVLFLTSFIGFRVATRVRVATTATTTPAPRSMGNQTQTLQLINQLAVQYNQPKIWRQLESRFVVDQYENQLSDTLVEMVIKHLKTLPRSKRAGIYGENLIGTLINKRQISDVNIQRFLLAYYGWPGNIDNAISAYSDWSAISVSFVHDQKLGGHTGLFPLCDLKKIEVSKTGKPLMFLTKEQIQGGIDRLEDVGLGIDFGKPKKVYLKETLPAGEHELTLRFTTQYPQPNVRKLTAEQVANPMCLIHHAVTLQATVNQRGNIKIVPMNLGNGR